MYLTVIHDLMIFSVVMTLLYIVGNELQDRARSLWFKVFLAHQIQFYSDAKLVQAYHQVNKEANQYLVLRLIIEAGVLFFAACNDPTFILIGFVIRVVHYGMLININNSTALAWVDYRNDTETPKMLAEYGRAKRMAAKQLATSKLPA